MRILYIMGGTLTYGGAESYVMSVLKTINKEKFQIDFILQGDEGEFCDEARLYGSQLYFVPPKSEDLLGNIKGMYRIIKNGDYDIVHSHADLMNSYILFLAKLNKIPIRISHSHTTSFPEESFFGRTFSILLKIVIKFVSTHYISCSVDAGNFLHPNLDNIVVKNSVDLERFKYDSIKRNEIRKKLNIENKIVLCNVARLSPEKNQKFLLNIMRHLNEGDYHLLLIGNGPSFEKLSQYSYEHNLSKSVSFLGAKKNVEDYLSASDIFLLPSEYEGFATVLLEAQANGLPCLSSKNVPTAANVSSSICYIKHNDTMSWIEEIKLTDLSKRNNFSKYIIDAGYDLKSATKELEEFYKENQNDKIYKKQHT